MSDETQEPAATVETEQENKTTAEKRTKYLRRLSLATTPVLFVCLNVGFCFGYAGPGTPLLINKDYPKFERRGDHLVRTYVEEQRGLFDFAVVVYGAITLLSIGAIVGCVVGAVLGHKFGRKLTILSTVIPSAIGWIMVSVGHPVAAVLIIGRLILGFCCGVVTVNAPIYLYELGGQGKLADRGNVACQFYFYVMIGYAFMFTAADSGCLYYLGSFPLIFHVVVVVSVIFIRVPESPQWLMENGKTEEARQVIMWLKDDDSDVTAELEALKQESSPSSDSGISLSPTVMSILTSLVFMFSQRACGIYGLLFFIKLIICSVGSPFSLRYSVMTIACFGMIGTALTAFLLIRMMDIARKTLLLISGVGMAVSATILAIYFSVRKDAYFYRFMMSDDRICTPPDTFVPFALILIFVFFYGLGYGPIPFMYLAECLAAIKVPKTRAMASCIFSVHYWSLIYVTTFIWGFQLDGPPYLPTKYFVWWIMAVDSVFSCLFLFWPRYFVETKGKTTKEIRDYFKAPNQAPDLTPIPI